MTRLLLRILIIGLVLFTGCRSFTPLPQAIDGILNLETVDSNTALRLDGRWLFYFNEFLPPNQPWPQDVRDNSATLTLPGLWQGQSWNHQSLPSRGFGTYRLRVTHLPWDDKLLSLYISDILSVGKVWVNGELVAAGGEISETMDREQPRRHTLMARFAPRGPELDILIQISNFHNRQGGINTPIWLGPADAMDRQLTRQWILTAIFSGLFLIMGIVHLILFKILRRKSFNLYFGLFCLSWGIQTLFGVNGGCLGEVIFPGMPWHWTINLTLFPMALNLPLMSLFYHALFPHSRANQVNTVALIMGALFTLYLTLTPPNAFDPAVLLIFLATLVGFIYLFVRLALDIQQNKSQARLLIPGYLFLFIALVTDILKDLHILNTAIPLIYGNMGFILSYSLLIATRLSKAYAAVETLGQTLQERNRQLSRLNRFKDDLLARTSHELKTPLNGIMGMVQSIQDRDLPPRTTTALDLIESSSRRLLSLINDLLDAAQIRRNELQLNPTPVGLKPVAETVVLLSRPLILQKKVEIENRIPDAFPRVLCDEDRLHQILFNLVGNSIKFTPEGRIVVGADLKGDRARIFVKDTGIGIDKKDLKRIFQTFEQGEQGADRAYQGTGLGLSITRDLVRLGGGELEVTSQRGKGTVFWFSLPLAPAHAKAEPPPRPPETPAMVPPPSLPGPEPAVTPLAPGTSRVMAVDDDGVNLQVVVNHLEGAGISVIPCINGPQALEALERGPLPDLMLVDVMMPGMTGYELARKIRQHTPASELPIIFLTARHQVQDIVDGFASGANDYLAKPFEKTELLARVNTQIHLRHAHVALKENLALKREVATEKRNALELKLAQRRLSAILDHMADAVVAVNPALKITHCNAAFEQRFHREAHQMLGLDIQAFFPPADDGSPSPVMAALTAQTDAEAIPALSAVPFMAAEGQACTVDLRMDLLPLDNEEFWCLVFPAATGPASDAPPIIQELNRNRGRLERLEALLSPTPGTPAARNHGMAALDRLLDQWETQAPPTAETDRKTLLVSLMNLSVDYWVAATQTTRVELAEQSGLWNVYIGKDGWARTQTLDKYLDRETLPARPRWKNVVNTADFVLSACDLNSPIRHQLEKRLAGFRAEF